MSSPPSESIDVFILRARDIPSVDVWFEMYTALAEAELLRYTTQSPVYGPYFMKAVASAPLWVRYHRTLLEGRGPSKEDFEGAHAYYSAIPYNISGISTLNVNGHPVYMAHWLWDSLVTLHNKSHK